MKQKKKKSKAKKTHNERIIKGRIIRDIRTDFEQQQQEVYYEPIRVSNFWIIITLNIRVMVVKPETYY